MQYSGNTPFIFGNKQFDISNKLNVLKTDAPYIVDKLDGLPFLKNDTELLMAMVNQAAIVLDNTKLFKLAITDGLTGLYLVRHFKNKLAGEEKRARRYNKIFSILFFDIDHFKKFNDTYGHQAGDVCLKHVGDALLSFSTDPRIFCARYGGDEFLILSNSDCKQTLEKLKKINKKLSKIELDVSLHVSGGI